MHKITGLTAAHTDTVAKLCNRADADSVTEITASTFTYTDHRAMLDALDRFLGDTTSPTDRRYIHTLRRRVLKERAADSRRLTEARRVAYVLAHETHPDLVPEGVVGEVLAEGPAPDGGEFSFAKLAVELA